MIHTIETRLKLNTTQELLVNSCVVLWSTYYRKTWKLWNNQQLKETEIYHQLMGLNLFTSRQIGSLINKVKTEHAKIKELSKSQLKQQKAKLLNITKFIATEQKNISKLFVKYSKIISTKVTEKEYSEIYKKAETLNLKLSKYVRLVLTEKELKINEFKTDEVLLRYGNHFIRITNLLRNREWNEFENKKQILEEIQTATKLIREYLYQKIIENEQFGNDEED